MTLQKYNLMVSQGMCVQEFCIRKKGFMDIFKKLVKYVRSGSND